MPWNVISSQWTGLYKSGRYSLNWHSINIACDGAKKIFDRPMQFQLSTSNYFALRQFGLMSGISWWSGLKKYRKAAVKYLFYFFFLA